MNKKIRFLSSIFSNSKLYNSGKEFVVNCPFCSSKKLKLSINVDSDKWQCWTCQAKGGNLTRIIKKVKPAVLREYQERFYAKASILAPLEEPEVVVSLPNDFKLVIQNLWDPDALKIRKYANARGITDDLLWRYRIGYSSNSMFKKRMIVPSFDAEGKLNYWSARSIESNSFIKYMNAKAKKQLIIFNEIDIDWSEPIVLVEGPLDLIKCNLVNSTCILGSTLSENYKLFQSLLLNDCEVILSLDSDALIKQDKIAKLLTSYDLSVKISNPLNGDLGDMKPLDVFNLINNSKIWDNTMILKNRINSL